MQQLELNSLTKKMPPSLIKNTVMVIGGAEDKVHGREILHTFFMRSGGTEAKLAIIPCASREPEAIGNRYREIFQDMGAKRIEILDIRERTEGEDPRWQEYLEESTGVFMTGGDQLRLCALVADTPLMEKLRMKVREGSIVLAGTSAGAAVMGHHMIAGGGSGESPNRSLVDMATGLGIIPEVIVDQHFQNRNRMARLLSAIASHPNRIGVGIDEDTCAMFEADGIVEIMGKGTVTIIDPGQALYTNEGHIGPNDPLSLYNLRVHILCHGDRFNIATREVIQPSIKR